MGIKIKEATNLRIEKVRIEVVDVPNLYYFNRVFHVLENLHENSGESLSHVDKYSERYKRYADARTVVKHPNRVEAYISHLGNSTILAKIVRGDFKKRTGGSLFCTVFSNDEGEVDKVLKSLEDAFSGEIIED